MYPGSLVLNPHTVSDLRQINSILRKGGGTVTSQENPQANAEVLLSGYWICCKRWAQWFWGEGRRHELRNLFSDVKTVFGFDSHPCQKGPLIN